MSTPLIRKATDQDFVGIWDIFHQVVKTGDTYTYAPDTTKEEAYSLWMPPQKETYVALINEVIVGTYFIRANQPGLGAHIANAAYMVHPDYRSHGIGKAMAFHSIEAAKATGFSAMQFNIVVSTNESAVHLWKKLGFCIIGTTPKGFKHLSKGFVDTHIMYRPLSVK